MSGQPNKIDAMTAMLLGSQGNDTMANMLMRQFQPKPDRGAQLASMVGQLGAGAALYGEDRNKAIMRHSAELAGQPTMEQQQAGAIKDIRTKQAEAAQASASQKNNAVANLVLSSRLPEAKKNAIATGAASGVVDPETAIRLAFPEEENRFLTVGGGYVFDIVDQKFLSPPGMGKGNAGAPGTIGNTGMTQADILKEIPPEQYDPTTYGKFLDKLKEGTALPEAMKILMVEQTPGWRVEEKDDGTLQPVLDRRSNAGVQMQTKVDGINQSAARAVSKARNTIRVVDAQLERLNAKDAKGNYVIDDGMSGAIWGSIAGTDEYDFRSDQETLLANLGLGELDAMRRASTNGASGLGQLTQRELDRLEALVASIRSGQSRENMERNLTEIRGIMNNVVEETKTDWSWDEFVYGEPTEDDNGSVAYDIPGVGSVKVE